MDFASAAIALFLFVIGAVIGSFLNVVIYRLPRGEPIASPRSRSHCPRCGRTLTTLDLVPLFSWIALHGRCRSCGVRISARYFFVETLTGLLFVAAGWSQGFVPTPVLAHELILIALFVPIFFIDYDLKIVPDALSVPLLLVGFLWNIIDGLTGRAWLVHLNTLNAGPAPTSLDINIPTSLVFACIGAGIFWIIQWFGEIAYRREAMGLGDVNIAAGIGANLPLLASLLSFGIAIAIGAAIGIVLILLRRLNRTDQLAFGPMLVIGALVMILIPDPIYNLVEMYRGTMRG